MKISWLNNMVLYVFVCVAHIVMSQNSYADFRKESDSQRKVEIGLEVLNYFERSNLDSLRITALELLIDSETDDNRFAQAVGTRYLGSYLIRTGNIEDGIRYLRKAQTYFEGLQDYTILSEVHTELGNAFYLQGNYDEAINDYLISLYNGQQGLDKTAAFSAKLGLAKAYAGIGDTLTAVYFAKEYVQKCETYNKYESASDGLALLGMLSMDMGKIGLANEYYEKSLKASKKSNSKAHFSHAANNKAIMLYNMGDLDSCLIYFEKSLAIREGLNHVKGIAESYYNIGSFYSEVEKYDLAREYFKKCQEHSKSNGLIVDEYDALEVMLELSSELGLKSEKSKIELRLDELTQLMDNDDEVNEELMKLADELIELNLSENSASSSESSGNSRVLLFVLPIIFLILFLMYRFMPANSTN